MSRLPLIQVPPSQTNIVIQEFKKVEQDEIQDVEGRCLPCVCACAALERHFTTEK